MTAPTWPPPGSQTAIVEPLTLTYGDDVAVVLDAAPATLTLYVGGEARITSAVLSPPQPQDAVERALVVIQDHRRVRNVRECSGCSWKPLRPGYASDPEATRRRHDQFNRHLAELLVDTVTGVPS